MTRVIIITGAGSGIGQGTALTFAERGDAVVIADIDLAAAQRTLAQTAEPSAHMALRCDVSDEASVQALIAAVLARSCSTEVTRRLSLTRLVLTII